MATVFHARPYGEVTETESNFGGKKLQRMKVPIFLEAALAMETI